jgi:hypothetical protein
VTTPKESTLHRYRRWLYGIAGSAFIYLSAILCQQPDVPVVGAPEFRHVSDTTIELTETWARTTTAGVVEFDVGFRSDGCTIPRPWWSWLGIQPLSGASVSSGVLHDGITRAELFPPGVCNILFLESLRQDGVVEKKAVAMYKAVELATPDVWAMHTADSINAAREKVRIRE